MNQPLPATTDRPAPVAAVDRLDDIRVLATLLDDSPKPAALAASPRRLSIISRKTAIPNVWIDIQTFSARKPRLV